MSRCIDADDFLDLFYVASAGQDRAFVETVEMVIEDAPTADVIDRKTHEAVCKQIMWERDIAIGQLKEIGKSLGEKMSDVAPVAHGRWIECWDGEYLTYSHRCSLCGTNPLTKEETMHDEVLSAYCPNCGAKMDGEVQDE